ncbi:uncharacterized protein C16orf46 homolog isoform X1 [Etheostoma spectabile]|uniref:Uncharacterized protein n=1 Tax=Etheostoma spectabile TaxID=54343 RepID=A0A5J5DQZ4_9PERO|nr:uncharacterized protein C16orf46 homolog isoform X1 [Etheostoma spectabile]XP_032369109.1 uncharacterized protein C16orf46 homolog isoform X1 [Etheostoma spectabile]XP_032369118.1 uncharacterized protein C16orf46 homolog isoform X1 [Etheostoma spectabile]XP_032369126.1 uncharacterized protein C16orf46 homolog isoform X1 [Etheostoma spectabile]XP_032369136.1 uncharacterized protein C16orf46 homolog isoform X1 [Etheostoma spectabile]XP_032369144.1 uncharacterized protein C16orf46 homolog isof
MATLKEVAHTTVDGSDNNLPTQEDPVGDQTKERRHVDSLLDISEEDSMKEQEPYEYHCYSGWEEAVHGWARVAPLSCILLTQKRFRKPMHKEADNPSPLSVDPTNPDGDSSASIGQHCCESHVGPHNSLKKSMQLNQHTGSWGNTDVAAQPKDTSEGPVFNAMQKITSNLLKEKIGEEGMLRETPLQPHYLPSKYSENRPTKPEKHRHRPNNTMVPIKNFTFLPPIKSPNLSRQKVIQLCSGKMAPEGEPIEENDFMFDKKSGTRGRRVDPITNPELPMYSTALTSKYQACQRNLHLFSAVRVSIPKRYQVPMSSKSDTLHRYSMGKSLTQAVHSNTAAGAQDHMHPSKTVCM